MRTKEEIELNRWEAKEDLQEVIDFIAKNSTKSDYDWSWVRNDKCKYTGLRIDMRSGHFVILDRKGNRITFDELKYQFSSKDYNENT